MACPSCGRTATVPPEKAALPNLKARCRCGTVYAVAAVAVPAVARPAPAAAAAAPARVTAARVAASPAAAPAMPADAAPRAPSRPPPWPRCANHPQVRSLHVCPRCVKGYCAECVQTVQGGAICSSCDGLCVPAAGYGQKQDTARSRDRSMWSELGLIVAYPFRDPLGFALLALFTWFASFGPTGIGAAVLMVYTFHALTRVSNGDLKSFMPDVTDPAELFEPARLAFAAFVISTGPLLAVIFLVPGAGLDGLFVSDSTPAIHAAEQPAPADEAEESDPEPTEDSGAMTDPWAPEPRFGATAVALLALALLWKLVYTPVAFTVDALSRSILSTINPVIGFGAIGSMGVVYWQCMILYTVLALVQWGIGYLLSPIPIAGALVRSFTDAYFSLAIACTLGLGVFKKAAALGWD